MEGPPVKTFFVVSRIIYLLGMRDATCLKNVFALYNCIVYYKFFFQACSILYLSSHSQGAFMKGEVISFVLISVLTLRHGFSNGTWNFLFIWGRIFSKGNLVSASKWSPARSSSERKDKKVRWNWMIAMQFFVFFIAQKLEKKISYVLWQEIYLFLIRPQWAKNVAKSAINDIFF